MNNEALRIENLHLSYKGLAGTTFSKPRALDYFDKNCDIDKELIYGANLILKRGETLCIGGSITSVSISRPKDRPPLKLRSARWGSFSRTGP